MQWVQFLSLLPGEAGRALETEDQAIDDLGHVDLGQGHAAQGHVDPDQGHAAQGHVDPDQGHIGQGRAGPGQGGLVAQVRILPGLGHAVGRNHVINL